MLSDQNASEILNTFKTNVEAFMQARGLSRSELSVRAGFRNRNKITTILNGDSLPNMVVPLQIASALGVSVEDLFAEQPIAHMRATLDVQATQDVDLEASRLLTAVFQAAQRNLTNIGQRPTMDTVTAWWKETGGNLANCDHLTQHFDLVAIPDGDLGIPSVHHVGAHSLSAQALGSHDVSRLESFLKTLNTADLDELQKTIRTVSHTGIGVVSPQTRIVPIAGTDQTTSVSFVRLMLPVRDGRGTPYVLNFSTLLSESSPAKKCGFDA